VQIQLNIATKGWRNHPDSSGLGLYYIRKHAGVAALVPQFEATFELISRAADINDLKSLMAELRDLYGLAHLVYHAVHLPGATEENPILLLTYDPEWVKRYVERDYFQIDPVVSTGRGGFLPLDWSELDHESFEARRFFKEADKFGVGRHGITIPIRAPGGERALLSITSNASLNEWRKCRLAYMRDFQFIGHLLHDQAVRLSGLRLQEIKQDLSRREKQTLQFAARGFAPKQIAGRLNLSAAVIRLYLHSARSKLECSSLNQAIAKATRLEIIES
jgi:DNA-binding CsgD family transcriptional regulator